MRARIPKAYRDLTPKAKQQLQEYIVDIATDAARKQEEQDCRIIFETYIKMVCCVLHDAFGFGEERLTVFIGNHKRLFARQSRLVTKGEQAEYLDSRMSEIFKKNGFPQDFINSLLGDIEIVDAPTKEE
jgi:hypothetical protein